ncbi:MAG: serine/threonine protein kinase, bacterial [Mycobacterium sp.]|jgi:serine/threonine-protein kinase|nr:serine/threonine protein kinase, bacterial [Mycobacterium sp.]
MPLASGETFAGYTILRLLGRGGMSEVYLAQHPRLPRRDALKILLGGTAADSGFRERFDREAELAATLWHPNIVQVHDRGEFDGQLWLAMDYVEGADAAQLMSTRYPAGMPTRDACAVITAVAGALDYAHQCGLLHRDVKPANILLTDPKDGQRRTLLADFGIARQHDDISGLTDTNFTVGTVTYAAPEQLMGGDLDARADQYALAATAFHLLTGAPPYQHSNPVAVISRHLTAPLPKLSDRRSELSNLDEVLSRALAKEPADRFADCHEFAAALAARAGVGSDSDHRTAASPTVGAPISQSEIRTAVRIPLGGSASSTAPPSNAGKPKRRTRSRILLGAALAAVVVTVVGVVVYARQPTRETASVAAAPAVSAPAVSAPPTSAVARPAVLLDGTYRFDYDYEKQTINGAPYAIHTNENIAWWAFRSSCTSAGCVAATTRLDNNNHQVARSPAQSGDYRFVDGHWQSAPVQRQLSQPRCLGTDGQVVKGTSSVVLTWSFEPQPDGTLRGTQTGTAITNECGVQGQVALAPVVATRVGDVPVGVAVADPAPAAVAPSTPTPHVAGPVLDGTYRLDFDLQNQTINGTVTGLATSVSEWWAFRSVCTSAGCAAAGSQLAESNQQEATGTTSVVNFADGHWQGTPTLQASMHCQRTNQAGRDDETRLWSWDPQADGTFKGLQIGTILSNGCGTQGTVYRTPFVATRTGDVAPSVIVADPALFTNPATPAPGGPH